MRNSRDVPLRLVPGIGRSGTMTISVRRSKLPSTIRRDVVRSASAKRQNKVLVSPIALSSSLQAAVP